MNPLRVELGERSYEILIGDGALAQVGEAVRARLDPSRLFVLADATVARLYGDAALAALGGAGINAELLSFPPGEESKSLEQTRMLYDNLLDRGADRKSAVLALGGGVTGDLAGFVAATLLRGLPFIQVPTTLLAQVDSSVGGKTGVNLPRGKNLVGAFLQPRLVLTDIATLRTLPPGELRCGLAEVVKHGVIRDADYFAFVEENAEEILAVRSEAMTEVVRGSCRIKAAVVEADEREGGLRAILNFGHTAGHAYETLTQYALRHGEAVAAGMRTACHLAEALGLASDAVRRRLEELLVRLGLSPRPPDVDIDAAMACMYGDKKTERGTLRFVLPRRIGEVEIVPVDDDGAVRKALEKSFSS